MIKIQNKKSKCWYKKILESTGDIWKSGGGLSVLTSSLNKKSPKNKE